MSPCSESRYTRSEVSVPLAHEAGEQLLLRQKNFGRSKRAVLITGIKTLSLPAPTPAPKSAPTPAPAPTPSPAPPVTAQGVHHVNTLTGDFGITRWSTFPQIPQALADVSVKLVLWSDARRYGADACAPSSLYRAHVNGTRWGDRNTAMRTGSFESSTPFAVAADSRSSQPVRVNSEAVFFDESGVQLTGEVLVSLKDWGPKAGLRLTVGSSAMPVQIFPQMLSLRRCFFGMYASGMAGCLQHEVFCARCGQKF